MWQKCDNVAVADSEPTKVFASTVQVNSATIPADDKTHYIVDIFCYGGGIGNRTIKSATGCTYTLLHGTSGNLSSKAAWHNTYLVTKSNASISATVSFSGAVLCTIIGV